MEKMKLIKRNNNQSKGSVFVVTRDNRRIEHNNYSNYKSAEYRALKLVEMLKQFDTTTVNKVAIVQTSYPEKIF